MILYIGDDLALSVPLTRASDGTAYPVDAGSTVRAALFNENGLIAGTVVTLDSNHADADWPKGDLIAVFSDTITSTLSPGTASIEVEINNAGNIQTTQVDCSIDIRQKHIP